MGLHEPVGGVDAGDGKAKEQPDGAPGGGHAEAHIAAEVHELFRVIPGVHAEAVLEDGAADDFEAGAEEAEEQELLPLLFVFPDDVADIERDRADAVEDAERSPDGDDVGLPGAVDEFAVDAFHEDTEKTPEEKQPEQFRPGNAVFFVEPGGRQLDAMGLLPVVERFFHVLTSFEQFTLYTEAQNKP